MNDSTQTIWSSAKRFFSGTLLSRISGMLRDMSMAFAFGAQASIASFMLAFRLAHLLRRLFGEGALQSAFIPEFESLRHKDEKRAYAFFRDLTVFITILLSGLILLVSAGLGAILHWGNLSDANREIIFLTLLILPSLLFICLYGLNASLLQCQKIYFTPSVAPIAFNGLWIAIVICLKNWNPPEAMPVLAIGVIFACFLQWLWTVPKTVQILRQGLSQNWWKGCLTYTTDLYKLWKPLSLGILGVAATQINNAVDSIFARYAELEGPALLWYSIRLQQLPLALFGIAIAGAILPPLSRAMKAADGERYQLFLNYALISTIAMMLPITALLFCMGDSCVNLIYGHGDFDADAVWQTSRCLWAYGIGLIPSALVLIFAPAYYSQNNYHLPAIAAFSTMLLNGILNAFFILILNWGAVSVAIATSISAWVNLFILMSKTSHPIKSSPTLLKILLSTCLAFVGTLFIRKLIQGIPMNFLIDNQPLLWPRNLFSQLFDVAYQAISFGTIWLTSCLALGISPIYLFTSRRPLKSES